MRYRLSQQVVLVRGRFSAALYDLHRSRLQTIPAAVADSIEAGNGTQPGHQAVLTTLSDRGFLREDEGPHRDGSFSPDASSPYFPVLRTVSFDLRGPEPLARAPQVLRIVREGLEYGLASVVLLVSDQSRSSLDIIVAALRNLHQTLLIETLVYGAEQDTVAQPRMDSYFSDVSRGDAAIGLHRNPRDAGFVRGVRAERSGIEPGLFITNYAYFHLLRHFGESHGCLHFDQGLGVYPDMTESNYRIAGFGDEVSSLAALLEDPALRRYWSFGKDQREKCRECVFRYACPNPLSNRSVAGDLASAPANCGLDLETGKWGAPCSMSS